MIDVVEAGYFRLLKRLVEIAFREIGDEVRFHGFPGYLGPFAFQHWVWQLLGDLDLANPFESFITFATEKGDRRTFDHAVLSINR